MKNVDKRLKNLKKRNVFTADNQPVNKRGKEHPETHMKKVIKKLLNQEVEGREIVLANFEAKYSNVREYLGLKLIAAACESKDIKEFLPAYKMITELAEESPASEINHNVHTTYSFLLEQAEQSIVKQQQELTINGVN